MVPGGNRPSSEGWEGVGVAARGMASVSSSDADPNAIPQAKQKRLRSGISAEQERHRAIGSHSTMGARPNGPVIPAPPSALAPPAPAASAPDAPARAPAVAALARTQPAAPATSVPDAFGVQVGIYFARAEAERVRAGMAARYGSARIVRREGDREMWRGLVGSETTESAATAISDRIRQESGERNAFVVRLDSY